MRTGSTLNFLLGDHLGSTAITTDSAGVKSAEVRYYPWGGQRYAWNTTPTTLLFTGQRKESSFGLYFYGARWSAGGTPATGDPAAGRFVQADSIVPGAGNPQAYERYAYTNNNLVKYTDPTGHCLPEQCGYTHDTDDGFSPIMDLIRWRENNKESTFNDENWFSEHPSYSPEDDELLVYAEQYIQDNGSYFGISASDTYGIRLRYNLYKTSTTTNFSDMATSFMMVVATGGISNNTVAIQSYWPQNNGFAGEPTTTYLMPGTIVDRNGFPGGSFLSPIGTPFEMRGLPPPSVNASYNMYEVLQSLEVQAGTTAPAFGYLGGGTQYMTPVSIQISLDKGIFGIFR